MLFEPSAHEPLAPEPWNEDRVRAAIRALVLDVEERLEPAGFWPEHPRDAQDAEGSHGLWIGAAGTLWALDALQRAELVELRNDYAAVAERLVEVSSASPDEHDDRTPSLWMGQWLGPQSGHDQ